MGEAEPLQARERKQRGADRAGLGLGQPRLDIAAQERGLEVRAQAQRLGVTAHRGGGECRAARQSLDRVGVRRDERVAHVLARQTGADRDTVGQKGGQILGRVHSGVDSAG